MQDVVLAAIHTLAMSDNVAMGLIAILGGLVVAITPAVIAILMAISRKLDKVEANTNGNLSAEKAKNCLAESRVPGISSPNGPLASRTIIVNDPTNPTPPIVTSEHPTDPANSP